MTSLRQKMLSGLFWSVIERFGQQGIQFIITIIIARILTPADYGLIGMLAIFIAVAQSFVDSGFGAALVQKQAANQTDFSTIFYFNIIVSILFFFIFFFTAPLIAGFYNQPLLTVIMRIMALNVIISSFGLIQITILIKNINFKTLTRISIFSVAISGCVGIFMAYRGFGVWSLIIQTLTNNFINTVLLWLSNKWRPVIVFSFTSLKKLFSFGSKLLASGFINQIFNNIYNLVIGKIYSPTALGYYTQAKRIQDTPVMNSMIIFERVTYPIYSTIQNDADRLKSVYRKTIKTMVLINFPLMIGLIVCAEPLVRVLLTEKWLPAVPYLQILCIAGMFLPLSSINLNILKVRGRTDIYFYLEIVKKIFIVIAILVTYKYGVYIMIFGQVCTYFIAHFLNIYYSGRQINYSIHEQITDIAAYLFSASFVGAIVYIGSMLLSSISHLLLFIIQIISFIVFYILLIHFFKLEAYDELRSIMNSRFLVYIHDDTVNAAI